MGNHSQGGDARCESGVLGKIDGNLDNNLEPDLKTSISYLQIWGTLSFNDFLFLCTTLNILCIKLNIKFISRFSLAVFFRKAEGVEVAEERQLALPAGHHEVLKTLTPENVRQFVDENDALNIRIMCR